MAVQLPDNTANTAAHVTNKRKKKKKGKKREVTKVKAKSQTFVAL